MLTETEQPSFQEALRDAETVRPAHLFGSHAQDCAMEQIDVETSAGSNDLDMKPHIDEYDRRACGRT